MTIEKETTVNIYVNKREKTTKKLEHATTTMIAKIIASNIQTIAEWNRQKNLLKTLYGRLKFDYILSITIVIKTNCFAITFQRKKRRPTSEREK